MNIMETNDDWKEDELDPRVMKAQVKEVLIKQGFYNPYDVFCHEPEFYDSDIEGYEYKIHIIKWNTKSTRMSILYARWKEEKPSFNNGHNAGRWAIKRASGLKRTRHGEKMR